jgi:hypothetical protein
MERIESTEEPQQVNQVSRPDQGRSGETLLDLLPLDKIPPQNSKLAWLPIPAAVPCLDCPTVVSTGSLPRTNTLALVQPALGMYIPYLSLGSKNFLNSV